jgi:hypothetical protein
MDQRSISLSGGSRACKTDPAMLASDQVNHCVTAKNDHHLRSRDHIHITTRDCGKSWGWAIGAVITAGRVLRLRDL